jgi:hypothetical protein
MVRRRLPRLAIAFALAGTVACGPSVDLAAALDVTDVFTGWYDDGINRTGWTHLVPSVTFKLRNKGGVAFNGVQLTVAFWRDGDDGEWDSVVTRGIGSDDLAAGASTEAITARAPIGYNLEGARADFFSNGGYKDVTVKFFAKRSGKIAKIGEARLDRRVIPHAGSQRP